MQFDYYWYHRAAFKVAIPIIVFMSVWLTIAFVGFIKQAIAHKLEAKGVFICIFGLVFGSFTFCMHGGCLINGGIYLIYEKEVDAIEIQGEILGIDELSEFSFPRTLSREYGYGEATGVQITINDSQCSAPGIVVSTLDLKVGDYVKVTYLPKSGYVLSIYKIEDASTSPALP